MANTYTSCYIHCVFRTHSRQHILYKELREELFNFIGGIARNHGMVLLSAGGINDHIHLLISLSPDVSISKALQIIKSNTSRWISKSYPSMKDFRWQSGFGAFTIGISQIERTKGYIENQEEHHRRKDFREEYLTFLKRHGIDYDERYVL